MRRPIAETSTLLDPDLVLAEDSKGRRKLLLQTLGVLAMVILSLWLTGMLDRDRLSEGLPAIGVLVTEMIPPDFARWRDWVEPLLETLAMSIAGTALAIALSLPRMSKRPFAPPRSRNWNRFAVSMSSPMNPDRSWTRIKNRSPMP